MEWLIINALGDTGLILWRIVEGNLGQCMLLHLEKLANGLCHNIKHLGSAIALAEIVISETILLFSPMVGGIISLVSL